MLRSCIICYVIVPFWLHPQAKDIPIPGLLGIVVGLLVGWFIFRIGKEASLKKLLVASTVVLLFIAGEMLIPLLITLLIEPQYDTHQCRRIEPQYHTPVSAFSPGFIAA